MGYTRYWTRTDRPINQDVVDGVKEILDDCARKGIAIRGPLGDGEPIVSLEKIAFNGNGEGTNDLSHESFVIDEDNTWNFCKTARKPYDLAVRRVLVLLEDYDIVKDVSSDGPNERICTDEEYIKGMCGWY